MKKTHTIRILAYALASSSILSLAGCGSNQTPTPSSSEVAAAGQETDVSTEATDISSTELTASAHDETDSTEQTSSTETTDSAGQPATVSAAPPATEPEEPEKDESGLTEQQRNSFSMLYYLAITAEEIRTSKDNRLILDDIYTSLLNDINPGAIDETTQDHLKNLRDIIKSFLNISEKRDRLQYIYNQEKAAAIRDAVPNPLAILSMTNSVNWSRLATSVVYTIVDSYTKYKNANASADQEFLMNGWDLDDEETAEIQKTRERAFDYMVDIVQEYGLDGKLTLNEEAIETFAEISEIETVQQKIHRLEAEEETYSLLGVYWLELADCYYQTDQYEKCLECVDKYSSLATGIFRKDYNYAQILPKAIVAAKETCDGKEYVSRVQAFADSIIENTTTEEWSARYFAADVYLDLYARTGKREYLEAAYDIAYDNVTILLDEQCRLNTVYLEDVQDATVQEPDYRFMDEKKKEEAKKEYQAEKERLKAYNKALKEARKTELPPLYEPLVLNCDLLFTLADEIGISKEEQSEIEDILHTADNGVFLTDPVNDHYSFTDARDEYSIELTKSSIRVPVSLLSAGAKIIVNVSDDGEITTFDDCEVTKVERQGDTIDTFMATISSKMMKGYKWTENSKVEVSITNSEIGDPLVFRFKVAEYKDYQLLEDKVEFEEE